MSFYDLYGSNKKQKYKQQKLHTMMQFELPQEES
jgi:hypothetical protein